MSTHPVARTIAKYLKEGATSVKKNGNGEIEAEFPKHRIAACMIMGDNAEQNDLLRCVNSLKKAGIDKIFIAFNGKSRRKYQWLWNHLSDIGMPFLVQKFAWEDDFSKARNQSFNMVPKNEFDWMMWIDTDDEFVIEVPEELKDEEHPEKATLYSILESLDPFTLSIFLRYDYATDPESGNVAVVQWRERILTTKVDWQWIYPVHEVVFSPSGIQFARPEGAYIKHHRDVKARDEETRKRNRRIIAKALRENPDHPRMQFYFANEAMAEAEDTADPVERARLAGATILAYRRFLSNDQAQREDLYFAATRVGDLYLLKQDIPNAVDAYLNSLKIIPDWPDAYIGLARAAMEVEDWARTKDWSNIALAMKEPSSLSATSPLTYRYTPRLLRGMASEGMGNYQDALDDYKAAIDIYNPPNGMLSDKIREVENKLAVTSRDKGLRKSLRGKRPEKSIAFVTAPLVEPWHPELEKQFGAGGAETCIMRLAPRFAADGWRVAVFGTPSPEYQGLDEHGIEWWESEQFLPNEEFTVLVSSRVPEVFEYDSPSKLRLLWMHDVNVGPRLYPFVDRIDSIIGLTKWHATHMSRLYNLPPEKFSVIPNGIELDLYDWEKKQPSDGDLRLIWSSSPDRGLGTVIALWPTIKSMYPTARLDIFYGWNIIDKLLKKNNSPYLRGLKNSILGNINRLGGEEAQIYQHGRVPQHELAQWQLNAHIWPYPTDFMETFCITAIEMQAAGVVPVTSKLAALNEVIANDRLMIEGWPLNNDYQQRWLRVFEEVIEADDAQQNELQLIGRRFAEQFTWDEAYSRWNEMFRSMNVG